MGGSQRKDISTCIPGKEKKKAKEQYLCLKFLLYLAFLVYVRIKWVKFTLFFFFFLVSYSSGTYHPKHEEMVYKNANRTQCYTPVQIDPRILFMTIFETSVSQNSSCLISSISSLFSPSHSPSILPCSFLSISLHPSNPSF